MKYLKSFLYELFYELESNKLEYCLMGKARCRQPLPLLTGPTRISFWAEHEPEIDLGRVLEASWEGLQFSIQNPHEIRKVAGTQRPPMRIL